jgi:hypothetical protein
MNGKAEQRLLSAQEPINPALALPAQSRFAHIRRSLTTIKSLLWAEWFAHGKLLLGFIALWLIAVWLVPLLVHPGWILVLGLVFALVAGPTYGGSDVVQGSEEFTFALPATRSERYCVRLIVGGGALLVLTALDLIALGLDLPQALIRFYLDAGLIERRPVINAGLLAGLVWAFPFAAFSFSFALAANARSRALIFTAWFWSALAAMAALRLGLFYEELLWDRTTGYFSCPLLLVLGAIILIVGHFQYVRKEVGCPLAPLIIPSRWWAWIILFLIGLGLALILASSLARHPGFLSSIG